MVVMQKSSPESFNCPDLIKLKLSELFYLRVIELTKKHKNVFPKFLRKTSWKISPHSVLSTWYWWIVASYAYKVVQLISHTIISNLTIIINNLECHNSAHHQGNISWQKLKGKICLITNYICCIFLPEHFPY